MLPITVKRHLDGANGRNWPGFVVIDPSAHFPAAVFAQEAWEAMHKLNPINFIRTRVSKKHRREMELESHEVEVCAAELIYGQDAGAYRLREAEAMRRGYDGLFAGMTVAQIVAAMESRSATALRWVVRNRETLERYR